MRQSILIAIVCGLFFGPQVALARPKATKAAWTLIETAPLRGLLGQLTVRGEVPLSRTLAGLSGALTYEQLTHPGERADARDRLRAAAAEGVYYPWEKDDFPVFLAFGLRFEMATRGRQRARSAQTWVRQWATERFDLWTEHQQNLLMSQALGYRLLGWGWWTAALRMSREELIATRTTIERDDVWAEKDDLPTKGRDRVRHQVTMLVGLRLP